MNNVNWRRVTRDEICPICKKPDWCVLSVDGAVAICARTESETPTKSRSGWVHRLRNYQRENAWRTVRSQKNIATPVHLGISELAEQLHLAMTDKEYQWLSNRLGVSDESLKRLGVGWSAVQKSYSFPMREPNRNICGIRYRALNDSKYSERGGRDGLFFLPSAIVRDYFVVVEGASDVAAMMTTGFWSVVGRSSCTGSVHHVVSLCRRMNPRRVFIVPDNDSPGIRGAESLAAALPCDPTILRLPKGVKDVRACISEKKNADWLRDQIGNQIQLSTNGETIHDRQF